MLGQKIIRVARNTRLLQRLIKYKSMQLSQKSYKHQMLSMKVFITFPLMSLGVWSVSKQDDDNEAKITAKEVLLAKADALFDQGQYKEIYDLLCNYRDIGDVEINWRISRALYNMSKEANEVDKKKMIFEGYDLLSKALSITDDNWTVHKWMSIFLDAKCGYDGVKARMREIYNIRNHMLRASELNPKDATTLYMIGSWHYHVSNLPWYQQKIVTLIYGNLPQSSFEEALSYFTKAEEVEPNFYSHNFLMLGKTYLKLNQKEKGLVYLKKAAEYPAKTDDDHVAKQEAQNLLNKM